MAPGGAGDSLVRTITQEGELSWEKCLAASEQKLLGEERERELAHRLYGDDERVLV